MLHSALPAEAPGRPATGGTVVGWRSPTCSPTPTWSRSRCWRRGGGGRASSRSTAGSSRRTAEIAGAAARRSGTSWYVIVQPDDLKRHVPSHEHDPADAPLLAGVPRPRRRGDLGARLLGSRRPPRRAAGRWRRPRAGVGVGRSPAGRAARLPGRRRARRHPAAAAGLDPRNPVNRAPRGVQVELPHPVRAIGPYGRGEWGERTARTPRHSSPRWPTSRSR